MTKYEVRAKTEEERVRTIIISGVTLTFTFYGGNIVGIETSQTLTPQQETMLTNLLNSIDYKIIWKDGTMLP